MGGTGKCDTYSALKCETLKLGCVYKQRGPQCPTKNKKKGLPIIKHPNGNFWKVMDDLLEIGFDGLHPIQPECMDLKEVKDHVQGRPCIIDISSCAHLLS